MKFEYCFFFILLKCRSTVVSSKMTREYSKGVANPIFTNKRILEREMCSFLTQSKVIRLVRCSMTQNCSSAQFNCNTNKCVLFDKDFIMVEDKIIAQETGWIYYHISKGRNDSFLNLHKTFFLRISYM